MMMEDIKAMTTADGQAKILSMTESTESMITIDDGMTTTRAPCHLLFPLLPRVLRASLLGQPSRSPEEIAIQRNVATRPKKRNAATASAP
jgi:hypothetical protein